MLLTRYFLLFTIYSLIGWIYETLYCTIKSKKWDNRGFLYGPIVPIYGVGSMVATILLDFVPFFRDGLFQWYHIFLLGFVGSFLLEYPTSYFLEKVFHAMWWDYSDMPLNIRGRVCLPATFGFGVGAMLIVYYVAPFTESVVDHLGTFGFELIGMILFAVFIADLTLTVSALTNFERYVTGFEDSFNIKMGTIVDGIGDAGSKMKEGVVALGGKASEAGSKVIETVTSIGKKNDRENEKIKYAEESAENTYRGMSPLSKSAVARIRTFKAPKDSKETTNRYVAKLNELIRGRKK